jgi:hypothetical protein
LDLYQKELPHLLTLPEEPYDTAEFHVHDLVAAFQPANRFRAFSFAAVERILAAFAEPRSTLESIDDQARQHLDELLRENPVPPRATSDYQQLLEDSGDLLWKPSTERSLDEKYNIGVSS